MNRLLNVALRGTTLVSKFLLVFVLAKFIDPAGVGVYGLLAAAVAYGLLVVGVEFYAYSTREIIGKPRSLWLALMRDQAIFYVLVYVALTPISAFFFFQKWLPPAYV